MVLEVRKRRFGRQRSATLWQASESRSEGFRHRRILLDSASEYRPVRSSFFENHIHIVHQNDPRKTRYHTKEKKQKLDLILNREVIRHFPEI